MMSPRENKIAALLLLLFATATAEAKAVTRTVTVTAYCACVKCCGPDAAGITASGKRAKVGMVAASRSIPFGTRLHISGLGWYTVQDRLSGRYDNRVDVYTSSHAEAQSFGKRSLKVTRK